MQSLTMLKTNTILQGDVLEKIKEIPDESIDCIITSPPYWGLRDYKIEGQWGLEPTFHEWIDKMLKLTLELKRVLKKSGTFWLNIGDTYNSNTHYNQGVGSNFMPASKVTKAQDEYFHSKKALDYPQKCLTLIPERLAIQMIDQGWILRNKIIWHKPNAMPASVRDRLKNSHEVVYLFVKNKKYYFDLDAIRVPAKNPEDDVRRISADQQKLYNLKSEEGTINRMRIHRGKKQDNVPSKNASLYEGFNQRWKEQHNPDGSRKAGVIRTRELGYDSKYLGEKTSAGLTNFTKRHKELQENKYGSDPNNLARKQAYMNEVQGSNIAGANPGDVWTIATHPMKEAHFATFPPKLVEPMILAGCPKQICSKCGFMRERQTKISYKSQITEEECKAAKAEQNNFPQRFGDGVEVETIGWSSCSCNTKIKAGICLDPFLGSGTVAVVAQRLGRNWLGIELKQEYIKMAYDRIYKKSVPISEFSEVKE